MPQNAMRRRLPSAPVASTTGVLDLFRQAAALHQQGRVQEAEQLYRAVLAADRRHAGALHLLGVLRGGLGDFADAARLIRKAVQQNPRSADAQRDLGNMLLALGRVEDAIARFEAAIALQPGVAALHACLGNALALHGRHEQAIATFETAIALKPDPHVHHSAAFSLAALGRHQDACAHYEQALALNPALTEVHYNLANALAALNRPEEAVRHYETVIARNPKHIGAHNNVGTALVALGRPEEAAARFAQCLALAPDNLDCLGNLATVLLGLNRAAEALAHCHRAVELKPDDARTHFHLGNALAALQRDEEAIASYQRAATIKPDYVDALFNRANSLRQLGRAEDAAAGYESVVRLKPDYMQAWNNLGNVLLDLRRPEDALSRLEQALSIDANCAEAHNNFGCALHALSRHDEALAHYEHALRLKADYADAYMNTGISLLDIGRLDEARRAFEQAIAVEPRKTKHYRNLIDLKRFSVEDPHLAAMVELAKAMTSFSPEDGTELHFALGKALADAGRPEEALRHLVAGNRLKRDSVPYDEAATLSLLSRLPSVFTPEIIRAHQGAGDPSEVPIFIIGMPRSGTTLIEQILASHSKVFGAGELTHFTDTVAAKTTLESAMVDAETGFAPGLLRELGTGYIAAIRRLAPAAERITDKMPLNFRLAGLIHLALPNARIIHARRNPVDTCLSCFSKLFTGDQPFTYDLGELGRYYRAYHALMEHWRRVLPARIFLEIDYEQVVADLEGQARRMVAHCGLDWEPACLEFYRTNRPVRTASASQVRQPLYKTAIGRSRPYRAMLEPLLDALGPELSGARETLPP